MDKNRQQVEVEFGLAEVAIEESLDALEIAIKEEVKNPNKQKELQNLIYKIKHLLWHSTNLP